MTSPTPPARRLSARGRHRRRLLVDAAGAVLMEQGFAAVSHRSVAERAGLPLAATTYYFSSLDELLTETVRGLAEGWLAVARAAVDDLPPALTDARQTAEAVVRVAVLAPAGGAGPTTDAVLSLYDRYLEAARHPRLRTGIAAYDDDLQDLLAEVLRRGGLAGTAENARLVLAVVDGAVLRALAEGDTLLAAVSCVEHLLRQLRATPHQAGRRVEEAPTG